MSTQVMKIGELLVSQGVMTAQQIETVLTEQKISGRPFGQLAEELFKISPQAVEEAWIEQYLSYGTQVDLRGQRMDLTVLRVLNRRQAWQFAMLPLRRENEELIVATTKDKLPKAVTFAWRKLLEPVYFMIVARPQLEDFLMHHYPWPSIANLPSLEQLERNHASLAVSGAA